jgi:hypothetical protein
MPGAADQDTLESLGVYDSILGAIGKTPLVRLNRVGRGLPCVLYAKVEAFNPGGSIKDRIAVNIVDEAERSGRLLPGGRWWKPRLATPGLGWRSCAL